MVSSGEYVELLKVCVEVAAHDVFKELTCDRGEGDRPVVLGLIPIALLEHGRYVS
jgi:hypothetical protein